MQHLNTYFNPKTPIPGEMEVDKLTFHEDIMLIVG